MRGRLITGPWAVLDLWMVSFNGGGTARKMFGPKQLVAAEAAAELWRDMCNDPRGDHREPSDEEFDAACAERLVLFTPEEWNARCLEDALVLRAASGVGA
jgi:hypothetical protein